MKNIKQMRHDFTAFNINQNPTTILLHTEEKRESGGAFEKITDTTEITVRIFQSNAPRVTVISDTEGTKDNSTSYGMLAMPTAPIRVDARVSQWFDAQGMRFEINAVIPQVVEGELVGFQCELKRVS